MGKIFQKLTTFWPHLLLILVAFFLFSYRLDKVPVHLNQDEMEFSLNAYSIAKTFRDQDGRFMPFYFWHLGSLWATPIIVYLTSLFLRFLPLSESTIRLPSIFVGTASIVLLMVLSHKVFKNKIYTLVAGILAVTTPVLFIHSRILLDNLYTVPFVLLWLLFLKNYLDRKAALSLFAAGLSLGIGIHSYHAAKVIMPLYFLATFIFFGVKVKKNLKSFGLFLLGFFIPIILFVPWLSKYPDTLMIEVNYLGSIDKTVNIEKGIWGVFNPSRAKQFASYYVTYLSPDILFFTGDRSLIHSTRKTGAFLFPSVFLLVFGILAIVLRRKDNFSRLILFGFLTYPVASALVNDPQRISRSLVVIPFFILICLYGLNYLVSIKDKLFRILVISIFVFSFVQFIYFIKGYFAEYPKESYSWFGNDIGGALESATKSTRIRKVEDVYIDKNIYFIEKYVKFYSIKFSSDLEERTKYFDPRTQDFSSFPVYSLVVLKAENAPARADKAGGFEKIETIREPNGYETFYIFYRDE